MLGLAIHTLLCLSITSPNGAPPAAPPSHLSTVIRSTWEVISEARPLDAVAPAPSVSRPIGRDSRADIPSAIVDAPPQIGGEGEMASLLRDMVMDGSTARAQAVLGAELGPELWKRLLG
jgi:hypothetical protein